jgi:hypothetical protein
VSESAESLIAYCRENSRDCPMPRRCDGGWRPPLTLILAAWDDSPVLLKMQRLREHIQVGR